MQIVTAVNDVPLQSEPAQISYITKPLIVKTVITKEKLPVKRKIFVQDNDSITPIGGYNPHNCVLYAQANGLRLSGYGWAKNYPTNASEPVKGAIVKLNEGKLGHLAVVVETNDNTITIHESNYRDYNTQRVLKKNDGRILGYII